MKDLLYIFSFSNFIMAYLCLEYAPNYLWFCWLLFPSLVFINMLRAKAVKKGWL